MSRTSNNTSPPPFSVRATASPSTRCPAIGITSPEVKYTSSAGTGASAGATCMASTSTHHVNVPTSVRIHPLSHSPQRDPERILSDVIVLNSPW